MARKRDDLAGSSQADGSGGALANFLAEEDTFDRRTLWRLGSWGAGTVLAIAIAILAAQSSGSTRRDQAASEDLVRQAQRIERVAKESQTETRRLASAVETLTGDRDRLFSRVTTLEQGLDSMTGSIKRPSAAADPAPPAIDVAAAPNADKPVVKPNTDTPAAKAESATTAPAAIALEPAPATKPVLPPLASIAGEATVIPLPDYATLTAAIPLMPPKSMMAPPDPAATRLIQPPPAAEPPAAEAAPAKTEPESEEDAPAIAVQRTEFGIDVGGASSIDGLRALWQRVSKDKSMAGLRPIIVVKERPNGPGMQLRLVAGPLRDAAAAAKLCAGLAAADRPCEPTVFDGQSLSITPTASAPAPAPRPTRRRAQQPPTPQPLPPAPQPPRDNTTSIEPAPKPSALSILLGGR